MVWRGTPVSYTHLEDAIYKDDQLDIEEYWNLIAARSADLEDADKLETYKKAVSYTHLDVYKRQIQRRPGCQ